MKDYNDYELLYMISQNIEEAKKILYEKYRSIIEIKANKYKLLGKKIGLEYNDLVQEGYIGFDKAIKTYKDNKDTIFYSFANRCIEGQLLNTLRTYKRKKHALLNTSSSLDIPIDEEGRTLSDILSDGDDPSKKLELEEENDELLDSVYKEMSDFEKNVFDLKMLGLEYKEIADLLDKSYKSVDSALQRIRIKIKKILDERN